MLVIKPNCQYLPEENDKHVEHVVNCAGICYGNDPFKRREYPLDYIKVYNQLIRSGHFSPLRHSTFYYIIPFDNFELTDFDELLCPVYYCKEDNNVYITVNGQYWREHPKLDSFYGKYNVNKDFYVTQANKQSKDNTAQILQTLRYTFIITTQISTSRELNRVSPNNICEQSTRYCKFSFPKFGEDVAICQPHWLNVCQRIGVTNGNVQRYTEYDAVKIYKSIANGKYYISVPDVQECELGEEWLISTKGIPQKDGSSICYHTGYAEEYLKHACDAASLYREALKAGFKPEDARGLLPLDTATKVVYTYSYKEWQHILDLRLRGTTGDPHPNCVEVMSILEKILDKEHSSY